MLRPCLLVIALFCIGQVTALMPLWLQPDFVRHYEWSPYKTDLIKDCSDSSYILDIEDITLTPAQPQPGQELLIQASGYLKERVDYGANAHVIVKLGVVQLINRNFDICNELDNNDTELKCPIESGLVTVSQKVTLPKETPRAHFNVQVRAENYDGAKLACLDVNIDFRRRHHGSYKNRLIGY
ncbi:ML domain-containing protein [Fennellomyces sp. T-0311]|nr:ML domain-containing protein [Fennellomyces sp. T-0311]